MSSDVPPYRVPEPGRREKGSSALRIFGIPPLSTPFGAFCLVASVFASDGRSVIPFLFAGSDGYIYVHILSAYGCGASGGGTTVNRQRFTAMCIDGEASLREWPNRLDDQVQRLMALQREMILLSRRLGPREHMLLLELVSLHDHLWTLTDLFKGRLMAGSSSANGCLQQRPLEKVEKEEESCTRSSAARMTTIGIQTDERGRVPVATEETSRHQVAQENEYALCEWRDLTAPISVAPVNRPCQAKRRLQCSMQYTEVDLSRAYSTQKLGLTLCYSAAENEETEIFVSEIKPGSLADRDGRIRTGDQVLEINGVNVRSRSQAVELFRRERPNVSILLARRLPRAMVDSEFSPIEEEEEEDDEGTQTDRTSVHEKDSGISRTTDSELELMPSLASPSKLSEFSTDGSHSSELISIPDEYEALKGCTQERVGLQSANRVSVGVCRSLGNGQHADSTASLEHELQCLQREMDHVQLECDRLIEEHIKAEKATKTRLQNASVVFSTVDHSHLERTGDVESQRKASRLPQVVKTCMSPKAVPLRSTGIDYIRGLVGQSRVSLIPTNACVTGRQISRRPPPPPPAPTLRDSPIEPPADDDDDGKRDSAFFSLPHYKASELQRDKAFKAFEHGRNDGCNRTDDPSEPEEHIYASISGETVYTNLENLQSTIRRQQQSLRQSVVQQALTVKLQPKVEASRPTGRPSAERPSMTKTSHSQECVKMEWKVKRRSDGTRYITRRPVRKQILKDRAERLASERFGCSTDDDAASELKVGRYWSKEERRQHRERCKERKKRQEEFLRRRAERKPPTQQQILQLSYKKMLRRQGQQLLDRFTTIQEFLTHGNRTAENYRALGLLSVTTV
uniref:PDZ domain-containing protein n=1 Tax=Trichuris muris TaxID=70415 RepID=A0A5S6R3B5_TRIMR